MKLSEKNTKETNVIIFKIELNSPQKIVEILRIEEVLR